MVLGCSRTRIKARLLSLVNNVNGPAVLFLWGLCVCAAGGSKVGSEEEPRTLGSVGGHWVVLVECTVICWGQTAGDDPADVKRCQSHQDRLCGPTEPSGREEQGQLNADAGSVCPTSC